MHLQHCDAETALRRDMKWLVQEPRRRERRLILIIDPNGPYGMPYEFIRKIMQSEYREQVDIILNFPVTAMKRLHGLRKAKRCVAEWIGAFDDVLINNLRANNEAWIREPIKGDSWQWTMLCYWGGFAPRGDWKAERFVKLGSARGRAAVNHYSKKAA
jgi:hypothetical protein